jgi:hypothetical protein
MPSLSLIPPTFDPLWKRFVIGQRQINSPKLAIGILEKNVRISYRNDPSPENVRLLVKKVHAFFTAYEEHFLDEFQSIAA